MTLSISNLHVSIGDKPILKGLTLDVPAREVHAIMGPNGAGRMVSCYAGDRRLP
jgi:Fe-S cluster assembly ATP-binding protein